MVKGLVVAVAVAVLAFEGSAAHAGVDPDLKCKDAKGKTAGLKASTLMKAFGKNIKKPNAGKLAKDISKAQSNFTKQFTKPEQKGWCLTTGDADDVEAAVDDCVDEVITLIEFGTTTTTSTTTSTTLPLCGNGVLDGDEQCDPPDYGGASCGTLGFNLDGTLGCTATCQYDVSGCECEAFPATGQTTCWDTAGVVIPCAGTGHDGDIRAGSPLAYMDNGDGTITDLNTGLMWAKKSDDGSVHDKDNTYPWTDALTVHVAGLNAANFAGHIDWRVPNAKELQSIVNYEVYNPSVSPAFNTTCAPGCTFTTCSCTQASDYWSSTTSAALPIYAWVVSFINGYVDTGYKDDGHYVRAVRGGS